MCINSSSSRKSNNSSKNINNISNRCSDVDTKSNVIRRIR